MPTKAQLVREALQTEVAKASLLKTVSEQWQHWKDETNLPAAYVILDEDDSGFEPTQSKTVNGHFRIAVVLKSDTPQDLFDDIRGQVETQIEDDPSLGGLANWAYVSGVSRFATSTQIAGQLYVRDIYVEVQYLHARGQP